MQSAPVSKYRPFPPVALPNRQWPNRTLTHAPIWCSVDLRDGNQALAQPMSVDEKLEYFDLLVKIGFKEIEIGFPSASQIEFDFCRRLIEEKRIPDDVAIQVLCQCREDLIARSCAALAGAKHIIFHLYNSTSPAQRQHVFNASRADVVAIATRGTAWVKQHTATLAAAGTHVRFEYSPESFTSTELDFALEICEAVTDVWQPTVENKIILNLPATVEYATPNVHADQIEWMSTHLTRRDRTFISLHTHNDRGTGIAATELALLAGADRVEGTLFGNGERTGNLDLVTVALNLYMHGIDPHLDFSDLNAVREVYERCTGMTVPPRQPYAGELVFTAFSGSHQDAIKKGLAEWEQGGRTHWDAPYLTIDPRDIGREYREVIRVNSQSGKGGVAYLLESEFGIELPKDMQREFGPIANDLVDALGREVKGEELKAMFWKEYVERDSPWSLIHFHADGVDGVFRCRASMLREGTEQKLNGEGNGPIAAFVNALATTGAPKFEVAYYKEHALGAGSQAAAIAYIQIKLADGKVRWGAAVDTNIELASIKAVLSALNRA